MTDLAILKTREDLEDILRGATWLGVGGGGTYDRAMAMLEASFAEGHTLSFIDADALSDGCLSNSLS